ncbi:septation protein A [Histophilus somni]|uniref:Inner membrane-spanning protein YciB n=3 Tax=Histophilus somni TaxID=731 RepID=YCIB_HISS1|nr:septation protein A [Histophilus somni]B0USN1.1 RecName: Full=Inner membrane-spanning protein YciB [Histophilus somni 2336]Q0I4W6.1 RecName: Full=Inner membrane-spanning protein YciB [Histophilus somni 129PT]ACA32465.1 intracellular septation protein A [Histophilus somni 2336]ARU65285.1 septation protein A [Histophilus somni]ARU67151.1 septation protein A [Histophilus somni]ARU69027.1 septation protein A [Histophilus somni]ARU70907.1 septation protein A [Histophilus somni]
MKQLLEFIPLILFFAVYKLQGIQAAAITLIIATLIQLMILKLKYGKIEKQQLIMGSAVVFFGSLSAYFNELEFLKWKVTVVYALFSLILLVSQYGFKKPLIQQLLGKEIQLPTYVWHNLNLGWAVFFLLCMLINLYISQYLSDDIWVDFKTFGILGMTLIATLVTGVYIYRYLPKSEQE